MMKASIVALLLTQVAAFPFLGQVHKSYATRLRAGDYTPMEGEGKINLKVDTLLLFFR